MDNNTSDTCHVVAVPYPGRGHVNPMINLCKSLILAASRKPKDQNTLLIITMIVTEEWLGLIQNDPPNMPNQIQFRTIPNVLPSELARESDFPGFYEAVMTEMGAPFEAALDRLRPQASLVVADAELLWAVPAAERRNVPVASLWTMSASALSMFRCFDLIQARCFREHGKDYVDFIPGVSPIHISDLPSFFHGSDQRVSKLALECVSKLDKAQFVLVNTVYELEAEVVEALRTKFHFPIYPIGPAIPCFEIEDKTAKFSPTSQSTQANYLRWLDSQPEDSVLYISLGSFLSVPDAQMEEIVAGVRKSGARFLWVARGDCLERVRENCGDFRGLVVPWCDQLRVLSHPSIGGFWTHCGWNSTLEGAFAGVPILAFPIYFDQIPNAKQIVEDWKVGWRVRGGKGIGRAVTRDEISEMVKRLMDPENGEGNEIRRRAREVGVLCRRAVEEGGSAQDNVDVLMKDMIHFAKAIE